MFLKNENWARADEKPCSATGQADFLQQRYLRHGAENFQKVWCEKNFEKILEKLLNFPEIYFGHAGTI